MGLTNVAITPGSGANVRSDDVTGGIVQVVKQGAQKLGVDALARSWLSTVAMSFAAGLQSLATSPTAGQVSAEVDLTAEGAEDVVITAYVTMTTGAGTPTGFVNIHVLTSVDGTTYSGDVSGYVGASGAYALGAAASSNPKLAAQIKPHANINKYAVGFSLKDVLGFVPPFFALVFVNDSGLALHSSGNGADYRVRV